MVVVVVVVVGEYMRGDAGFIINSLGLLETVSARRSATVRMPVQARGASAACLEDPKQAPCSCKVYIYVYMYVYM